MITYEQIQKANEGLASIDVKGKDYVLVAQRVKAFRLLFPEGFIKTNIISLEAGVCVMQTSVGFYDNGHEIVLGTGMAYEKEANGYINKTSYIENCETSSVGRALGFLALGVDGGGICSAEELANAISNQKGNRSEVPTAKPVEHQTVEQKPETDNISEIRKKLETGIKTVTEKMSKADKIAFLNTVICPTINGQRNWHLCDDPNLLKNLLGKIEQMVA